MIHTHTHTHARHTDRHFTHVTYAMNALKASLRRELCATRRSERKTFLIHSVQSIFPHGIYNLTRHTVYTNTCHFDSSYTNVSAPAPSDHHRKRFSINTRKRI